MSVTDGNDGTGTTTLAKGPLRVGLPKGRLFNPLTSWLREKAGIDLSGLAPRGLVIMHRNTRFFILKPRSIPQLVALNFLDAGFCGRDILMESAYDDMLAVAADTGLCPVKLCVGSPDPSILVTPPKRPIVIATEFPRLSSRWAFSKGLSHLCLNSWGSTEAWAPAFADMVIDTVETGATMEAHGLTILETILESRTILVEQSPLGHSEFMESLGGAYVE